MRSIPQTIFSTVTPCGAACNTTNADVICDNSACTIVSCDTGFLDCDASAGTGCEINGNEDLNNCGSCGSECIVDNGEATCAGGSCAVAACDDGYEDCDGDPSNGCESFLDSDADNCGACGAACGYANGTGICVASVCRLDGCDENFEDCNGDGGEVPAASDGCEADLTSPDTCGDCDTYCNFLGSSPVPTCDPDGAGSYECNLNCIAGFRADCDGDPNNGCESDLLNSALTCGSCTNDCELPNTNSSCLGGQCAYLGGCVGGFGDCNRDVPLTSPTRPTSDGCEVATTNDVDNCGGCGNLDATFDCDSGGGEWRCEEVVCIADSCPDPSADCDADQSTCESDLNSTATCGSCGTDCFDPPLSADAGGHIVDAICNVSRLCEATSCQAPYADCDEQWTNGCEVNTSDDPLHCGGCTTSFDNNQCEFENAIPLCTNSVCEMGDCVGEFRDANNDDSDGCECTFISSTDNPEVQAPFIDQNCDGIDGDFGSSIFVATWGTDSDSCGTPSAPCLSINKGIQRSTGGAPVLVSEGTYPGKVTLRNGGVGVRRLHIDQCGPVVEDAIRRRHCTKQHNRG